MYSNSNFQKIIHPWYTAWLLALDNIYMTSSKHWDTVTTFTTINSKMYCTVSRNHRCYAQWYIKSFEMIPPIETDQQTSNQAGRQHTKRFTTSIKFTNISTLKQMTFEFICLQVNCLTFPKRIQRRRAKGDTNKVEINSCD